jgi:hypothetical protein
MPFLLVYGLGLVWGWGGQWARRGMGVPGGECWGGCRSVLARVGYAYCYEASYAYAPSPRRLLPSHLHSVCQLALREGVRHVVHLPPPEGLLGYPLGEVVGLSATLLQCSRRRGGRAAGCLRWRVCVRTGTSGVSLWLRALELAAQLWVHHSWFELQAAMGGRKRTTRAFQQQLQQQHSWDTNTGSIPP